MAGERTIYNFPELRKFSGFVNDLRFTTWGDAEVRLKLDGAIKKPGENWENKGAPMYATFQLPKTHEALRLFEDGTLSTDKRIYVDGGGIQMSLEVWQNKEGQDRTTIRLRAAPWTKVGASIDAVRSNRDQDPEVVDDLGF